MFGYVKPYVPSLTVAEHAFYKSIYCGLCHTLGVQHCHGARFALRYDFVFLALCRMALTGEGVRERKRRCMAHPLTKRWAAEPDEALRYAASAAVVLLYYKLDDDVADSRGARRAVSLVLRQTAKRGRRHSTFADTGELRRRLDELAALERANEPTPDAPAAVFGALLGAVFEQGLDGAQARIARDLGEQCGKWIYLADAIDDFPRDVKSGAYNPFTAAAGDTPPQTFLAENRDTLYRALQLCCEEAMRAVSLLSFGNHHMTKALLCNILTEGMPREARRLLYDGGKDKRPDPDALLAAGEDITAFVTKAPRKH